jgi:exo-beta-1,3-glucanase (GH17 family)
VSRETNKDFAVKSRSSAAVSLRRSGYKVPGFPALLGTDFSQMSRADKVELLQAILRHKIHGISFSPYVDGQSPGAEISEPQIRERLSIIQPYTHWIRSFSCREGNQETPRIAHENGLKTMVGVVLSEDLELNEIELRNGIEVARAGHADILAVGNEVMLREDLTEDQLIDYIERAKAAVPGVPVGTVDAYFLFENHPRVAAACDTLLVNCYPFWESCPAEYALLYMKEMYRRAQNVAGGKKVIISETGWPTVGSPFGAAVPSYDHALEYFIRTYQWAHEEGVEIFYFSSFDESWKVGDEGDVGAYWGLWDAEGNLKYEE